MTEEDNVCQDGEEATKDVSKSKDKKEKHRVMTKVVCRRLPPTMTEETFLEQVSPIPEHDFLYFVKPDLTLAPDLFSRAYINFVDAQDVFIFRDKFDDYIFLDEKGNEYPAIVEYAPFQRIPKKRRKKDPKSGSLENDSSYLEYLESLKEVDSDCREPKMEYSFQLTEEKKETTTPLLEFLASRRREERRRKEERQKRRLKNRNIKEDDIIEEEVKKIKPRDSEKAVTKTSNKKKEDEAGVVKQENTDTKDKYNKNNKSGKDSKSDKKEYKNKLGDGETKLNRKERRERQREAAASKGKELKKNIEARKEKVDNKTSFRQIDEVEQDEILALTIESKTKKTPNVSSVNETESSKVKTPLISNNIKPFTEYKTEELAMAINEIDSIEKTNKTMKEEQEVVGDFISNPEEVTESQERKHSLESGDNKSSSEGSPLHRQKSIDDKSQDDSSGKEGTGKDKVDDDSKERRLRNKDRPSLVIYQPGMGKFSKQRIDRGKEGAYKQVDEK